MASEDVIELGSSDDEPDPAPKKAKSRPNAMVHIPAKLQGVTIKQTKAGPNSVSKKKTFPGKGVPIANMGLMRNPYSAKVINKPNGRQSPSVKVLSNPIQIGSKSNLNPMNLLKNINNSQLNIKKITNSPSSGITAKRIINQLQKSKDQKCLNNLPPGITVKKTSPTANKQVTPVKQVKAPMAVINSIHVNTKLKRTATSVVQGLMKKRKTNPNLLSQVGEVLTVELDDDDGSQSSSSPQWYVRPEDHSKDKVLEEQKLLEERNNKEPELPKFIEITIEDSPIKPPTIKRKQEVKGSSITIDDSPVKSMADKNKESDALTASCTDDEIEEQIKTRTPNSKKKLKYSKETDVIEGDKNKDETNKASANTDEAMAVDEETTTQTVSIEIEIEPINIPEAECVEAAETADGDKSNETNVPQEPEFIGVAKQNEDIIIEIEESPAKIEPDVSKQALPRKIVHSKLLSSITAKPKVKSSQLKIVSIDVEAGKSSDDVVDLIAESEFHPIYQSFIDMCFKLENSEDMKKIVEKKIKTYYRQVPKEYTESEEFIEMVSSKILAMKAGPDKMYLYIKDIVDELNLQRKIAKSETSNKEKRTEIEAAAFYGEEIEKDAKRKRQVRKLEKTLKKLHRAIQKLEEQEVDFDDDGDSVYILTESEEDTPIDKDRDKPTEKQALLQRYKERLVRVHAKLCQLSNTKMPSEPRLHIEPRPGQPTGPARRLEKWINRRVPVGTPLPFPDFHDVLRCVRDANKEDQLGWNEADIMEEARDLFTRCGKKLQRRRQENEWRLAASRISADVDPAEESEDLKKKLDGNRKVAAQKESELINKYADRQNQLKLEAVEIGDKEADESPVESGDDAPDDQKEADTLENRQERKDRLKRLLKQKASSSQNGSESPKAVSMDIDEEVDETDKTGNKDAVKNVLSDTSDNKHNDQDHNDKLDDCKDRNDKINDDNDRTDKLNDDKDHNDELDDCKEPAKKIEDDEEQNQNIEKEAENNTEKSVIIELESVNTEVEICTDKSNDGKAGSDSVHTLSDDSKKVDSDVDELHLLQKLHSGTDVASSTLESSDTDTPIAISDTLESSDGAKNKRSKISSDVVSIENSSYSETENTKDDDLAEEKTTENKTDNCDDNAMDGMEVADVEIIADAPDQPKKQMRNSNEEYTKPVEDILLASSDEESNHGRLYDENSREANNCDYVNLKDDSLTIGDTIVEGETEAQSSMEMSTRCVTADSVDDVPSNSQVPLKYAENHNSSNRGDVKEKEIVEINSVSSAETLTEEEGDIHAFDAEDLKPGKINIDESLRSHETVPKKIITEATDNDIETIESNSCDSKVSEDKEANNEEIIPLNEELDKVSENKEPNYGDSFLEDLEKDLDDIYESNK